jgi:hypothetical protein
MIVELMTNTTERRRLAGALANWHYPNAARDIAEAILKKIPPGRERRAASIPLATERRQDASGTLQVREPDEVAVADLKFEISNLKFST